MDKRKQAICGYAIDGVIHFKTLGNQGLNRFSGTARIDPFSLRELI